MDADQFELHRQIRRAVALGYRTHTCRIDWNAKTGRKRMTVRPDQGWHELEQETDDDVISRIALGVRELRCNAYLIHCPTSGVTLHDGDTPEECVRIREATGIEPHVTSGRGGEHTYTRGVVENNPDLKTMKTAFGPGSFYDKPDGRCRYVGELPEISTLPETPTSLRHGAKKSGIDPFERKPGLDESIRAEKWDRYAFLRHSANLVYTLGPDEALKTWDRVFENNGVQQNQQDREHIRTAIEKYGVPESPADVAMDALAAFEAKLLTAAQIKQLPPPRWLVKGLIPEQCTWRMYGPSGSYKSFIMLDLSAEIGRGGQWCDLQCRKGTVLYVVAEGRSGIGKRIAAWEKHHGETFPAGVTFAAWPVQIGGPEWFALLEHSGRQKYDLIVFDTQARTTVGKDENGAKDMGIIIDALTTLAEISGCAAGMVHHSGYDNSHGRGSTSVPAAVDAELAVAKSGESVSIKVVKQKDGPDGMEYTKTRVVVDLGDAFEHETSLVFVAGFEPVAAPDPLDTAMVAVLRDRGSVNGATLLASLMRDVTKWKGSNQRVSDRIKSIHEDGGSREVPDGQITVKPGHRKDQLTITFNSPGAGAG